MPRTILLVDDDAALVRNLEAVFRKEGYTVASAHSAADGLRRSLLRPRDLSQQ